MSFISHVEQTFKAQDQRSPQWTALAQNSLSALTSAGVPDRSHEAWRYLSLNFLKTWAPTGRFAGASAFRIKAPTAIENFKDILSNEKSDWLSWTKNWILDAKDFNGLVSGSLLDFGAAIKIPAHQELSAPIEITVSDWSQSFASGSFWLELGEYSKATLIIHCLGQSTDNSALAFFNQKIRLAAGAELNLVFVQEIGAGVKFFEKTSVILSEKAKLKAWSLNWGAAVGRSEIDIVLNGENAEVVAKGFNLTHQAQALSHHSLIDHAVGNCKSEQLFKCVVGGEARSTFDGQVRIRKNANGADSKQLNQNLILNAQAEVNSKPQLQVFADDVKATHGSTVGQLNDDEVFYLRSRGLSKNSAEELLAFGFVEDVFLDLPIKSLKKQISQSIRQAMTQLRSENRV